MTDELSTQRVELTKEYFRRVDAGADTLLDLFTDNVQLYFPKFGDGHGKDDLREFATRLGSQLRSIEHDIEGFNILVAGDHVVVEGFEKGVTRDGESWPDGVISTGRFCNVFEFDGLLIKRVHVYVDPDFTSSHKERIAQLAHR
ncbi:hypothetical protein AXA44_34635 [Rhodococcus sp. SC4]|nr:hypothetical protein AXA44_34635 [Rhodococcus sp. SC4]